MNILMGKLIIISFIFLCILLLLLPILMILDAFLTDIKIKRKDNIA